MAHWRGKKWQLVKSHFNISNQQKSIYFYKKRTKRLYFHVIKYDHSFGGKNISYLMRERQVTSNTSVSMYSKFNTERNTILKWQLPLWYSNKRSDWCWLALQGDNVVGSCVFGTAVPQTTSIVTHDILHCLVQSHFVLRGQQKGYKSLHRLHLNRLYKQALPVCLGMSIIVVWWPESMSFMAGAGGLPSESQRNTQSGIVPAAAV